MFPVLGHFKIHGSSFQVPLAIFSLSKLPVCASQPARLAKQSAKGPKVIKPSVTYYETLCVLVAARMKLECKLHVKEQSPAGPAAARKLTELFSTQKANL